MIPAQSLLRLSALFLVAITAGVFLVAQPAPAQLSHRDLKAEEFMEYITVAEPYTGWQMWPGTGRFSKGKSSYGHGELVSIYVNRPAYGSIEEKKRMTDGSIIVVENYDSGRILSGLTAMYKVDGYNGEAGDWYWVEATPGGTLVRSGKVQPCINCHRAQMKNDYLWTGEIVKGGYDKAAAPDQLGR
jgi:hypothetical protein